LDILNDATNEEYRQNLMAVPGLEKLVKNQFPKKSTAEQLFLMEFALHGLAEYSMLSRKYLVAGLQFKDLLGGIFNMPSGFDDDDDDFR